MYAFKYSLENVKKCHEMLYLIILHVFMRVVRGDCLLFFTISNWMSSWILFKGYFGDVNKGIYKPMGISVAVKTCKETFT